MKKGMMKVLYVCFAAVLLLAGCGKTNTKSEENEEMEEAEEEVMFVPSFTAKDLDGNTVTEA